MVSALPIPQAQQYLPREAKCFYKVTSGKIYPEVWPFLLWWMNLQPLKRREPSSAWQARLYYITERFVVFTAGPGFPFMTVAAVTLVLCSRQGSLRFEGNGTAAWVLHPHLSKDRPLSVTFLMSKAAAISPSANSYLLRSAQDRTV